MIEEKYDQVRRLINMGKERGYLLYDEVNDMLPAEVHSLEEIDDLLATFECYGIYLYEDVSSAKAARAAAESAEISDTKPKAEVTAEEVELDLAPGTMEKTNDPVRIYLREMGTVPLLTRDRQAHRARANAGAEDDLALPDHAQGDPGDWRRASQVYSVDQGNCSVRR